jgi:hypothetical protein
VLILGAGFSHAVSALMPLTNDLGHEVIDHAGLAGDARIPSHPFSAAFSFESWLSLLAEDQPHLSEAQNLENAALFSKIRESIYSVLSTKEAAVFRHKAPAWLGELLTVLHFRRATVATLNYDTIIEVGVGTQDLPGAQGMRVNSRDILRNMPLLPPIDGARFGADLISTFRLLKLHGSLNWWWVPKDQSGASLARIDTKSTFGDPEPISDDERREQLPGREPFIVPPSSTKSSYYRFPYMRELWRTAFDALRSAEHISLVGYSLPPPDLVMGGMLETALRGRNVSFDIVNPAPDELLDRIRGIGMSIVTVYESPDCIEAFVHDYRDRAAREFAEAVGAEDVAAGEGTALLVAKRQPGVAETHTRITGLERSEGGIVVLHAGKTSSSTNAAIAVEWDAEGQRVGDTSPRLSELIPLAQGATRLVLRRDGVDETIVGASFESSATGVSPRWIAFESV